ncbi:MAG: uroporphyrinogen decarboxylase family protein [Candidatus Latescibacteria bacterium]|jgi:hypothetical protein|nr:uroporphyrinogen decarboxylase family protein [Candidatus Latescibacterota bacterium]
MTSHEIVYRTLEFSEPERVAQSFKVSDFASVRPNVRSYATGWQDVGGGRWERIDEWGNKWGRVDATSKGEVVQGVLDNFADLSKYVFPDYSRVENYAVVREKRAAHPDQWLIGSLPGFTFNIARKMRKLEQYLMDLLIEHDTICQLHDQIDAVLLDMIRNYAEAGVDGVMFPEDWGTQTQLLINPNLWHEEFFPRFQNLCDTAHACNLRVFMHSCGEISAIVPGLIDAGIDVLQFDQPDLHGMDTLAAYQENAKITFWCPVDIQTTLQTQNEGLIREKAREMLDKLWNGRGGFIAGYYGDNASIGLDPKWQEFACDEFVKRGSEFGMATVG